MTRVAALDCGTNSLRLLVADIEGAVLTDVVRRMEVVRLGAGVDQTGRLAPEALARTFAVLDDYAGQIRGLGADAVRMVATSATRDASNRDEFVAGVRQRLGVAPEVVTGNEEAALSFAGATRELQVRSALATPYLVVDIGGGSTEFVLGGADGPVAACSVDIGCVRMTERHLLDDPPTDEQIAAARSDVVEAIERARSVVAIERAETLIGLAGSVTTVVALALGLEAYDAERIHHSRVAATDVRRITAELLEATREQRAAMPVMHPGRVDVIGGGALVLDTIMAEGGFADVVASEHDILDGIAFSIVDA
jgi:exopolyphosphatase/guanosine-5'-triphosphate,3'-diphosphate pyrophosphatase